MTGPNEFRDEITKVKDGLIDVVEKKVTAATTAATISALVLTFISTYFFKGHVPDVVITLVDTVVIGALTFLGGYIAKHTHRTVVIPPPPVDPTINQRGL